MVDGKQCGEIVFYEKAEGEKDRGKVSLQLIYNIVSTSFSVGVRTRLLTNFKSIFQTFYLLRLCLVSVTIL